MCQQSYHHYIRGLLHIYNYFLFPSPSKRLFISMSYSSSRNYQYDSRSNGYRGYQQRDQSKRYPERDYRDRSQSESERQSNRDKGKQVSRSREKERGQLSIKIESKPRIIITGGLPRSQIKDHFVFNPIKIDPNHEEQLMEELRKYFEHEYGSVSHFSKSYDSKPGSLIMKLGFETDSAAMKALEGNIDEMTIRIDEKPVKIQAKPTLTFKALLIYQDKNKKQKSRKSQSSLRSNDRERSRHRKAEKNHRKDLKRRRHSSSYSSSSSQKSSSSSQRENSKQIYSKKYDRSTHSRREQASNDRSGSLSYYKKESKNGYSSSKKDQNNSKDRSFERGFSTRVQVDSSNRGKQAPKVYKMLLFWGIPLMIGAKRVDEFLQKHRDGRFISKRQLAWRKLEGSEVCNVLQGQFQQKMVQKLLQTEVPMQIDGHPFIVIDSDLSDKRRYVQKLSDYQVNIKLPTEVEPFYVMKSLKLCGKIIQVVSNNKFTESGLSDSYNVTFASKEVCKKFKSLKKTSKGISIYEVSFPNDFVPIYRPTQKIKQETKMESEDQEISQRFSVSPSRSPTPRRSF